MMENKNMETKFSGNLNKEESVTSLVDFFDFTKMGLFKPICSVPTVLIANEQDVLSCNLPISIISAVLVLLICVIFSYTHGARLFVQMAWYYRSLISIIVVVAACLIFVTAQYVTLMRWRQARTFQDVVLRDNMLAASIAPMTQWGKNMIPTYYYTIGAAVVAMILCLLLSVMNTNTADRQAWIDRAKVDWQEKTKQLLGTITKKPKLRLKIN
jgi:hypothetical protein